MSGIDLLRKTPLFAAVSEETLASLAQCLGKRTFARGMILFHKGSPGHSLYLIEQGKVRIFILSEAGQDISLNIHGPGDCFGELALLDGFSRSAGAMAIEQTVTYTLQRQDFLQHLDQSPQMARALLAQVSNHLRNATDYAESLAFLDVYGRVASILLRLGERYGVKSDDGVEIDMRLTQSELASYVAASREMVNRVMTSFRSQGLISIEGQCITILDEPGLRNRIAY